MFGRSLEGMKVDRKLEEGDKIYDFEVLHTPGHTKGEYASIMGKYLYLVILYLQMEVMVGWI